MSVTHRVKPSAVSWADSTPALKFVQLKMNGISKTKTQIHQCIVPVNTQRRLAWPGLLKE
jgi:hypothetical protein